MQAQGQGVHSLDLGGSHVEVGKCVLAKQKRAGSTYHRRNIIQFVVADFHVIDGNQFCIDGASVCDFHGDVDTGNRVFCLGGDEKIIVKRDGRCAGVDDKRGDGRFANAHGCKEVTVEFNHPQRPGGSDIVRGKVARRGGFDGDALPLEIRGVPFRFEVLVKLREQGQRLVILLLVNQKFCQTAPYIHQ